MGMFDYVTYKGELPDGAKPPGNLFQTKDFGRTLDLFEITDFGQIKYIAKESWGGDGSQYKDGTVLNFHGFLNFYASEKIGGTYTFYEYMAKFTDGLLVEVMTIDQYKAQMVVVSEEGKQ